MRILGLDPSLTNFGWALHDTSAPVGHPDRCIAQGRFQTSNKTLFIDRYSGLRKSLRDLIDEHQPDAIGQEFPVFNSLFSEGLYGLFLYTCEALRDCKQDVVFWSPLQVKAHARESLNRPKGWEMMKPDMVEAAKADSGPGRWNHNEADAYLVARLSGRFWDFMGGRLSEADLTPLERKYFTEVVSYSRGKKAGQTVNRGVMYREDERFFRWSQTDDGRLDNGESSASQVKQVSSR